MKQKFELLPHTADIKIKVFGHSLEDLFENALYALFACVGPIFKKDSQLVERVIKVNSLRLELLLVDFLSECLALSDIYHEVYTEVTHIELTRVSVTAQVKGCKITGFSYGEIKAVTYHDLEVKKVNNQWQALLVFDI
jgi:SHS2 domain-containing protein